MVTRCSDSKISQFKIQNPKSKIEMTQWHPAFLIGAKLWMNAPKSIEVFVNDTNQKPNQLASLTGGVSC
jgi:hypothetical protein